MFANLIHLIKSVRYNRFSKIYVMLSEKYTFRLLKFSQFFGKIFTVSTVNRHKNMPACFFRHSISNETLE